jgi:putative aldouronate transport system substrate-binding protein
MFYSRIIGVTVAAALAFTACGNRGGTAGTGARAPSEGGIQKPEKIVVMGSTITMEPQNGAAEFLAAYEKLTGVKMEFIKPAHNQYNERVDLAFASGDLPDVFEPPLKYAAFAANGALWDVTDAWYNSPISGKSHKYVADTVKVNGRLYQIPTTHGNGCITYVRKDWLDKLGLSMPRTYGEFYNMLTAFRDRDPDGDGIKNTIPFIAAGVTDPMYVRDFYQGGPDVRPGFFVKNGAIVEGMYDPDLQAGLKKLAQAYKEGLVDQEVVTLTTSAARDKFYTGKVGVFTYWAGQWNQNLQVNLAKTTPQGIVEAMPPIEGTFLIDRPAAAGLCIPAANKNPLGIFKHLAEVAFDGGEGQMLFYHGVEGKHWVKENGTYKKLPDGVDPSRPFDKSVFNIAITMYPWADPFPLAEDIKHSLELFNANAHPSYVLPANEDITGLQAELDTARAEITAKIVMGTYTVEEGVDLYRKQNGKTVEECLAVMNKLYKL